MPSDANSVLWRQELEALSQVSKSVARFHPSCVDADVCSTRSRSSHRTDTYGCYLLMLSSLYESHLPVTSFR
jgi:hypothetical protein